MDWKRKRKGWSDIWTHPQLERAVVDTRGFGLHARISYNGHEFASLAQAKEAALKDITPEQVNLRT